MKMRDLEQYGIPSSIVDIWCKEESEVLLPVQQEAIGAGRLLEGNSLVVSAPSSAGKTFIAEIAAVRCALQQGKALFLVSHKAIAEEKFVDFQRKYGSYGLRVAVSTGDHRVHDEDVSSGRFDLAVLTYEKCLGFLVASPGMASDCALLVVDEIQMLSDDTRGPDLELLLTRLRDLSPKTQLLALSGVLGAANRLDEWLGATFLSTTKRPIPLREGICRLDGSVRYWDVSRQREGREVIPDVSAQDTDELLPQVVAALVRCGEQVLVFASTRQESEQLAQRLASQLRLPPAREALSRIEESEASPLQQALLDVLRAGVAFHNADLFAGERLAIEECYRERQVSVVVSTSTLAMGVNMPARTVIIPRPIKYARPSGLNRSTETPLSVAEYKNMTGRAGRYRYEDEFGRSLLLADTRRQEDAFWSSYVLGQPEPLEPQFGRVSIGRQVLHLIAAGVAGSVAEVLSFISRTYSHLLDTHGMLIPTSSDETEYVLRQAKERGLLIEREGRLTPTAHGRLCARNGLEMTSYLALWDWVRSVRPRSVNVEDVLPVAVGTAEVVSTTQRQSSQEFRSGFVLNAYAQLDEQYSLPTSATALADEARYDYDRANQLRAALGLTMWCDEGSLGSIEKLLGLRGASIRRIADQAARVVDTCADIAIIERRPKEVIADLRLLARRIQHGVRADCLDIAELKLRRGHRGLYRKLADEGLSTRDRVLDTPIERLSRVVPRPLAQELHARCMDSLRDENERCKHRHIARLAEVRRETETVRRLYEQEGANLERAVTELLNAPEFGIEAKHITRQRRGEPDIIATFPNGDVATISVSASDRSTKPIGQAKCGEILASGARYRPKAYIVVGRPCFHDDAVTNADEVVAAGTNYKLVPINVLAEIYVQACEGKMDAEGILQTLLVETGLLGFPGPA